MYKTGGFFAILSSICHLGTGVVVVLQPIIFQDANVNLFLNTMAANAGLFVLYYLFVGLSAVFGIGVVEQITDFLDVENNILVRWAQKLAYAGFAVLAVAYFKVLTVKPYMASIYVGATEKEKEIILTMDPYISLAPNGIVIYGFVGIWIVLISILSLKKRSCPLICNVVGVVTGIVLIAVIIPSMPPVGMVVLNIVRGIVSFLWFGLLGINMIKTRS